MLFGLLPRRSGKLDGGSGGVGDLPSDRGVHAGTNRFGKRRSRKEASGFVEKALQETPNHVVSLLTKADICLFELNENALLKPLSRCSWLVWSPGACVC